MADLKIATDFVLAQEDATMLGNITTLPGDRGGPTRYGLASAAHPDLVQIGFYSSKSDGTPLIGACAALDMAEEAYEGEYAAPLLLTRVASQDVANRLLSFAINEGPDEAVKIAQRACNDLGCTLAVDGEMGQQTLFALNAVDPGRWILANRAQQESFYDQLMITQPALAQYRRGLLARADA